MLDICICVCVCLEELRVCNSDLCEKGNECDLIFMKNDKIVYYFGIIIRYIYVFLLSKAVIISCIYTCIYIQK